MERGVFAFDQDAIGKFQRTIDGEKDFARRAELDDGVLNEDAVIITIIIVIVLAGARAVVGVGIRVIIATAIAIAVGTAELDGNPHRSGSGKEFGQAAYDAVFESVSSCLVGHGKTSTPEDGADQSPHLPG